ncbi:MAG: hypothetical protein ACR2QC_03095 [Gammaproteobacteria bacterium]
MKKTTGVILSLSFAVLSGCSPDPGFIVPATSPDDYALSCDQIQDEVFYNEDILRKIESRESKNLGFWDSVPFAEEKLRDLRTRNSVLLGIYAQKGCGNSQ